MVRPTAIRRYAGRDMDVIFAGREQQVDAVLEGSISPIGRQDKTQRAVSERARRRLTLVIQVRRAMQGHLHRAGLDKRKSGRGLFRLNDFNMLDSVASGNPIHYVHTFGHLAENRVAAVEMRLW